MEHFNAISTQDDEGVVEPEPEPRQETVVSKGRDKVDQNTNKPVTIEYKPRVPHPNTTRKDRSNEQLALSQIPNAMKFLKELLVNKKKLDEASHVELNKLSFKEVHEPCSKHDRGHIHEKRRLRIEELDEWRAHKSRTHDKPKLCQNKPDTSLHQLKVGDKVLLDVADPHIVTTTLNEEIPLIVLSIFPFGTVEVSHPKFSTFKFFSPHEQAHGLPKAMAKQGKRHGRVEAGHDFPKTREAINPHGRATWPWVNLIGEHGRGNGKTRAC
ncbi:hypothetical protein GOBAR_AA07038 [Gossypium barbadense]|uniref:Uncharacterized protein n=1 Tax=Gossypium barbadense TaxID=3634 RepID=A0A2P5YD68_GOSBA|nr:hypothetical protein GOBAR_AA07038 [Gossypium barbadense]